LGGRPLLDRDPGVSGREDGRYLGIARGPDRRLAPAADPERY